MTETSVKPASLPSLSFVNEEFEDIDTKLNGVQPAAPHSFSSVHGENDEMDWDLLPFKNGGILHSDSTSYKIIGLKGQGGFGTVATCLDLKTNDMVALKIHKDYDECHVQSELDMLEDIRCLDPDKDNVVRFMESFSFQNTTCMVFEMLDMTLWDLINKRKRRGQTMALDEIRHVTKQVLLALGALKKLRIMHADLKSDNIMFVNHREQPYRVKLIDFGSAMEETDVTHGMMFQASTFRAPEVTLGLPLSTAIDMWGVGCIMAHMFFGLNIFPGDCPYRQMKMMLHLLGQPGNWPLDSGFYSSDYFVYDLDAINPGWRLRTPEEYKEATGCSPKVSYRMSRFKNLENTVLSHPMSGDDLELKDRQEFLKLLKGCLQLNSKDRITASEALNYRFVTMAHLPYGYTAQQVMTRTQLIVCLQDCCQHCRESTKSSIYCSNLYSSDEISDEEHEIDVQPVFPRHKLKANRAITIKTAAQVNTHTPTGVNDAERGQNPPRRRSFAKRIRKFLGRLGNRLVHMWHNRD